MLQHPQYLHHQLDHWSHSDGCKPAPPPQDYRQWPPPLQYVQQHHQPPAPRQRTAIACRYCRRRKIRCSGFEATENGRCSNCIEREEECVFNTVSGVTQAFVPAHTVGRGFAQLPPMYGAYGQPLPPASHGEPYGQPSPQLEYLRSPTGGPYPAHSDYGPPSASPGDASRHALAGRKRLHPEPHTPTLPPPHPGLASQAPHQGTREGYTYPEPPSLTSAASTANTLTPYYSAPPPAQPCHAAQPPGQASPQNVYRYELSRTSSSPHSQASTIPGAPYYAAPPQPNGALQPPPVCSDGRTPPPPTSTPSARPSMRINDLVSDNGPARSSTDSSMLNMLNRRPM